MYLRGRGHLHRILLEKVGGTYLSLRNKNSDLIFLENFTGKGGRGYLPPTYLFQDFTGKGRGHLPISNLFEGIMVTYRSKKSNAVRVGWSPKECCLASCPL